MFCTNCGTPIDGSNKFCTSCGTPVWLEDESPEEVYLNGGIASSTQMRPLDPGRPNGSNYLWGLLGFVGGIIGFFVVRDKDRKMANRILTFGIAVSVLSIGISIALFAYTSSTINSFSAFANQALQTTTTFPQTTVPQSDLSQVSALPGGGAYNWTIYLSSSDGNSSTAELSVGDLEQYQAGITNGDVAAGSACTLSTQTDAVIPAVLTLTNTSSGTAAPVGIDFSGIGSGSIPDFTGPSLIWEADYSTGPQCTGQNDGSSEVDVYSSDDAASGSQTITDAFFDITDYYPSVGSGGSTSVLGDTDLTIPSSFEITNSTTEVSTEYQVTSVSGPGVVQSPSGWEFTLAGTDPPS